MKVLFVASECFPLIKTGGLADVVGALPLALADLGIETKVLLPGFPQVMKGLLSAEKVASIPNLFGGAGTLLSAKSVTGLDLLIIDAPHLYDIEGNPYVDEAGMDRENGHIRFAALSYVGAQIATGELMDWQPELVHVHDWQAALVPVYLSLSKKPIPKTILTIHNLAFQGLFEKHELERLRLPWSLFNGDALEYWGRISFMKGAINLVDCITTVSPTYALEIQTDEDGMGMGGLLRKHSSKVAGIINGIDCEQWDPASDKAIWSSYEEGKAADKALNKKALQEEFGLKVSQNRLLFCVISRLTEQKGLDMLPDLIPHIVAKGGQIVVLGSGHKSIEDRYKEEAEKNPRSVAVYIGYNEELSHKVQAGSDAILIPSRFEPCGLTQLYGLRYGTVPVVARVGGLADTVIDANEMAVNAGVATGIQFQPVDIQGLKWAIDRTFSLYDRKRKWRQMIRNGMRSDVSWAEPAKAYDYVYRDLLSSAR